MAQRVKIPMDPLRRTIFERSKEIGLNLQSLSIDILGKKSRSYVHQFLNYQNPIKLDGDDRDKLADALKLDRSLLRKLEQGEHAIVDRPAKHSVIDNLHRKGDFDLSSVFPRGEHPAPNIRETEMPGKLSPEKTTPVPVFGLVQGGRDGSFLLNTGEPIMHIERPIGLAGRTRVYALRVEGVSMYPIYDDGDLIFVDPGRKPYSGRDAVIELYPEENEYPRAFLKRIVSINGEFITVKEWQPKEREFTIERRRIKALHLVLKNNEMY